MSDPSFTAAQAEPAEAGLTPPHLRLPRPFRQALLTAIPGLVLLATFNHPLNSRFLNWFQAEVGFQWFAVAGVVTVCFAGGYAAAQYRQPELREMALPLAFAAIYMWTSPAGISRIAR